MNSQNALLVLTPHSSGQLPADVLRDMLGENAFSTAAREALLKRVFLDGDPFTDVIYSVPGARFLPAPWSRFAVDLNRERDDRVENGVIKLTTFDRQPLYPPDFALSGEARETRLRRYWDSFNAQVAAELSGTQLLIVGHCMAPNGPQLGPDTGTARPAICLMLGAAAQPTIPTRHWPALQRACQEAFADVISASPYRDVKIGVPWDTDPLSLRYSGRSGTPALGIELNSGLYLQDESPRDEVIRVLNAAFQQFAREALRMVQETDG